ncbi:MAG TPA: stage III sporulation protein AC [Firmicutes bacterium]|nr:stage III sporulation protein AC [Bacillota bacterium]
MDISIIFKIAGVGLITAIVSQVLKKSDKDEIATLATLAGLIIVLFMIINLIMQLFDGLKEIYGLFYSVCPYLK